MKSLPDSSVDMIFADPPYNMQVEGTLLRTNGTKFEGVEGSDWDEFDSLSDYKEFTRSWLKEAQRILKKDRSSLWVIGSYQNIHVIGDVLQELGFWLINDIIWSKTNPTPNFQGTKFTNKQELLIWATPSKKTKYTFNYKTMKELNGGKQMTSVWDIPVSSGSERIKDDEGNKLHPTQKPDKLMYNVIISSTKKGDLVLDPFMGSGTTGAIAKRLSRNYFGSEMDEKYVEYSKKRIDKEIQRDDEFISAKFDIKPPKVSLEDLVKDNYLYVGQKLYFKKTDTFAEISEDFNLKYEGKTYGHSKLGGILANKDTNENGWLVWYVQDKLGKYMEIDKIRQKYRKEKFNYE